MRRFLGMPYVKQLCVMLFFLFLKKEINSKHEIYMTGVSM